MIKKFPTLISLYKWGIFIARVRQHENSIRSALFTNNDHSLIGRAERIPLQKTPWVNSVIGEGARVKQCSNKYCSFVAILVLFV